LQRIDPATNELVATIRAGGGADGVAAGEGAVFLINSDGRTLSRIDPKSDAIVKRVSTVGTPISVALGRDQGRPALWVTSDSPSGCELSQFDPSTLLTNFASNAGQACGPVATRGEETWFGGSANALAVVDPVTGSPLRVFPVGFTSAVDAHGLAVGGGAA